MRRQAIKKESVREQIHKDGFTIIELIIVMSVIAILVLLAVPKFLGYTEKARFTRDIHLAKTLETGLEDFMVHGGELKDHLDIVSREDIQASADKNMLLNPRGFVEVVEDGVYYELTYDFIKNYLNIKVAKNEKINDIIIKAMAAQYPVAAYAELGGKALVDRTRGLKGHVAETEPEFIAPEVCPTPESLNFEFDHLTGTITKYTGAEVHLNIPPFLLVDGKCYRVRIIGKEAFMGKGILTIQLPATIITIEDGAFSGNNLTDIIIPEGTKVIGDNAFKDNFLGTDMKPNNGSITEAGTFPSGHSGVILPDNSLESIGAGTFENNKLESVIIPDSVKNIGDNAFKDNDVSTTDMPSDVIIGDNIFEGNKSTTVTIPEGVKTIPANTFKGSGIISVIFPEGLERIEDYAFAYNQIVEVNLPSSLVYVGNYAFAYNQIGETRTITTITFKGNEYASTLDINGNILRAGLVVDSIDTLELADRIFYISQGETSGELPSEINPSDVIQIASGTHHSLALMNDGSVMAWGYNFEGQLGDGTKINRTSPVTVKGLTGVVKELAAGFHHSLALMENGTVMSWGGGQSGQMGDGTTNSRSTPGLADSLTGVVDKLVAGGSHSLALMNDGTVKAWGHNYFGQLGDGTNENSPTPKIVNGLIGKVKSVGAGELHSLALMEDGRVLAWGRNEYGQLGDGTTTQRVRPVLVKELTGTVKELGAGESHSLALMTDGSLMAWGYNNYAQLGDGTKIDSSKPVAVIGLGGSVKQVVVGYNHALVLMDDGTVKAWGRSFTSVKEIALVGDVRNLGAGEYHSLALMADGSVKTWGQNTYGQLGDRTTTSSSNPIAVKNSNGTNFNINQ